MHAHTANPHSLAGDEMSGVALLGRPLRVTVVAGLTLLLLLCRLQKSEGAPASLAKRETQSSCTRALQAGNIVPLTQVRPDDFPEYFQLTLNVTCHGKIGHPLCMEWQNTSTGHLAGRCETALSRCLLKTYGAAYAIRSKRLAMNTERTRDLIAILASRQSRSTTGSSQHIADVEEDITNCLSSAAVSVVHDCSGQLTDENALYACTEAESSPLGPVSTITMVATVLGACLVAVIVVVSVVVVANRKNWFPSIPLTNSEKTPLLVQPPTRIDSDSESTSASRKTSLVPKTSERPSSSNDESLPHPIYQPPRGQTTTVEIHPTRPNETPDKGKPSPSPLHEAAFLPGPQTRRSTSEETSASKTSREPSSSSDSSLPGPLNLHPHSESTENTPSRGQTIIVKIHPTRPNETPDEDKPSPSLLHDSAFLPGHSLSQTPWEEPDTAAVHPSTSLPDTVANPPTSDSKTSSKSDTSVNLKSKAGKAYRRSQSSNNLYGVSSSSDELQHADRKHRPKGIFSEDGASDHRIKKPSPPHRRPASPSVLLNGPIHTDSSDSLVPKTSDSSDSLDARRPAGQSSDPSSFSSGAPLLEDAKKGSNGSGHEGDNEMSPSHSECSSTPNSSLEGPPKRDPKKESPSALPVPPEQIETSPKCSEGSSEETSSSNTSDSPPTSDSSLPVPLNPHPLTEPTESTPLIEPTTSDEVPPTRSTSPPARP